MFTEHSLPVFPEPDAHKASIPPGRRERRLPRVGTNKKCYAQTLCRESSRKFPEDWAVGEGLAGEPEGGRVCRAGGEGRGKRPLWLEHGGKWEDGGGVPRGQVSRCAPGRVVWISAQAIGTQRAMDTAQSETSWELVAKEDAVGTDARALEEEPTRGMRSQGSRRKWSLGEGFTVRKEWSCQTIWGGGETCPGLGKEEVCGKRRRNRRSRGLGVDTRQQGHYK